MDSEFLSLLWFVRGPGRGMTYGQALVGPMGNIWMQRRYGYVKGYGANALRRRGRGGRRRGRRRRYGRVPRTLAPYSVTRKLKSVLYLSLNPGAGALSVQKFELNNAFDPTGSMGSGQPLGFDQYSALYQRCCVIGWSCRFEVVSTDNSSPIAVGFTPLVSSTDLTKYEHYKELPKTSSSVVTPDIDKLQMFARGGVKRFFLPPGGKILTDDTLSHAVSGGPSRKLYGHVWAQAMDGSSDPALVHVTVTLVQMCVFYVPEVPARS